MKDKKHDWVAVLDPETGDCVEMIDGNDCCEPYAGGDYQGHCGGCGNCMLMQAEHGKFKLKPVGENLASFYWDVFAKDLHEALGERSLEMSDYLLKSLGELWNLGIYFGQQGFQATKESNNPPEIREALKRLAAQSPRTTGNPRVKGALETSLPE